MATNCIWYGLETLKKIGSLAKNKSNYHSFCIDTPTRAWIIALGIRSRPAKYRRNRAGKDLFYHLFYLSSKQKTRAHNPPVLTMLIYMVHLSTVDQLLIRPKISNLS